MKLITAFLVVTPFLIGPAFAQSNGGGDGGDGERTQRIQRSIYEVIAGDYPGAYASGEVVVEGRAATMSEPVEPVEPSRRLGPGSPSDPEYFQHETNIRD